MAPTNTLAADWVTSGNVFTGTNALGVGTIRLTDVGAPPSIDTRVLLFGVLFGILVGLVLGIGLSIAFNRARRARPTDTARFPSHGI